VKDAHIKHLEARCELQKHALDESSKLIDMYEKRGSEREKAFKALVKNQEKMIDDLNKTVAIQENVIEQHDRILLRAYHLDLRAEFLSLGYPPLPDASLPILPYND
jgi:uncharacterized coiled-coil protein SlyX